MSDYLPTLLAYGGGLIVGLVAGIGIGLAWATPKRVLR